MRIYKHLIYIIITIIACRPLQAQNYYLPDYYASSSLYNVALINPAYLPDASRFSLGSVYKSRTGLLNEVASTAAYGAIHLKPEKRVGQALRLLFFNEKEGPYISSPKGYANYALKIPINEDISLYTGLALGMASMSFTAASGMGTVQVPDGNAGCIFKFKKLEIGASAYQIFNSSGRAVSSVFTFKRFFQFYAQSEKELSAYWSLKGNVFWRSQALYDLANATLLLQYKDMLSFGTMYQLRRGTSFLAAFQINQDTHPIKLHVAYNSLLLNTISVSTGSFEIGLQYHWLIDKE